MKRITKAEMIESEITTVVYNMLEGFATDGEVDDYIEERMQTLYDLYYNTKGSGVATLKVIERVIAGLWTINTDDRLTLTLRHHERIVRGIKKRLAASVENH